MSISPKVLESAANAASRVPDPEIRYFVRCPLATAGNHHTQTFAESAANRGAWRPHETAQRRGAQGRRVGRQGSCAPQTAVRWGAGGAAPRAAGTGVAVPPQSFPTVTTWPSECVLLVALAASDRRNLAYDGADAQLVAERSDRVCAAGSVCLLCGILATLVVLAHHHCCLSCSPSFLPACMSVFPPGWLPACL